MSLFGKLDAANIPTNPFKVDAGTYSAVVTVGEYRQKKDNGGRQLHIEYQINDPDSEFNNRKVGQYFDLVDESMTEEQMDLLPPDEKSKIKKTNSAIKRTLCGNASRDDQPGLGLTEDDLNDPDWTPEQLVGLNVDVTVYNYGTNNDNTGVRFVNLQIA